MIRPSFRTIRAPAVARWRSGPVARSEPSATRSAMDARIRASWAGSRCGPVSGPMELTIWRKRMRTSAPETTPAGMRVKLDRPARSG